MLYEVITLPENTIPYIKKIIQDTLNGIIYNEFDWE